jgi:hypothetical protein
MLRVQSFGVHVLRNLFLVGAALMILVSACAPGTDPTTTVSNNPDTTQAPDTTQGSDTTQAPTTTAVDGENADSETPWWLLLLVLAGFLLLIVAFVSRGSRKNAVVAPPPVSWKDNARSGYADARWLYDAMTEDLAVWRGNALFDAETGTPPATGTSLGNTWQQLDGRMGQAGDELYALEASAPDQRAAQLASVTISTMRALRSTMDARAASRMNYRTTESGGGEGEGSLSDAREREVRSSRNLAEARSAFGTALTNLSTLL